MIHCHPKIQLLISFVHMTIFTFIFFLRKKKKKKKKRKKKKKKTLKINRIPYGQGSQKFYLWVTKYHVSLECDNNALLHQ
jgi:amino acid transporter